MACTDFSRTFDRVNNDILLSKLYTTGVSHDLVAFSGSYICNRHQFVLYSGTRSDAYLSLSGIPQGRNS